MAVLAAIIVTALRNLFKQFKDVPQLYRKSKLELMVWLVTFAMAFVFSCEIGKKRFQQNFRHFFIISSKNHKTAIKFSLMIFIVSPTKRFFYSKSDFLSYFSKFSKN